MFQDGLFSSELNQSSLNAILTSHDIETIEDLSSEIERKKQQIKELESQGKKSTAAKRKESLAELEELQKLVDKMKAEKPKGSGTGSSIITQEILDKLSAHDIENIEDLPAEIENRRQQIVELENQGKKATATKRKDSLKELEELIKKIKTEELNQSNGSSGSEKISSELKTDLDTEEAKELLKEGVALRYPLISNDLIYQPIPGDGHCLYNAVGLYCGQDQQTLRNIVAANIRNNLNEYQGFTNGLENLNGRTINDYLRDVESGKEWAANMEIAVLMKILDRPIIIVEHNNTVRNLSDIENDGKPRFSGEPIFVYYNGHDHYDALLKINQTITGEDILNKLKDGNINIYREKSHHNEGIHKGVASSTDDDYDWYEVGGGGNCLFKSIAHQLNTRNINVTIKHIAVRNQIADYINSHWDEYKEFITDRDLESAGLDKSKKATRLTPDEKEKYINYLKKDGVWGDNVSIKAAAAVFRVNVIIKSQLSSNHNVNESVDSAIDTIYIGHIAELHYQSLFLKQRNLTENNGFTNMKKLYNEQSLQQLQLLKKKLQLGLSDWGFENEEDLCKEVKKQHESLDEYKEKGQTKLARKCEKNLEPLEPLMTIYSEIQELQNILNEQDHANIETSVNECMKFEDLKNSFTIEIQEQIVGFLNLTCLCPKNANVFLSAHRTLQGILKVIVQKLEQVNDSGEESAITNAQALTDYLDQQIINYNQAFATEIRLTVNPAEMLFGFNKNYIPPKNIVETIYRKLSLYFHPDKMSMFFVSGSIQSEFLETFKIIHSTKEILLKTHENKASIDYYKEEGTKAFNLAVKFQHAKNGDFYRLNKEEREEFRKIARQGNEFLFEHMCYQASLAYSQYKEACKLADKHKEITEQLELRKLIAICLYMQQDYLVAQIYLCGSLKILVKNFNGKDAYFYEIYNEINKWLSKIKSKTSFHEQKQPVAEDDSQSSDTASSEGKIIPAPVSALSIQVEPRMSSEKQRSFNTELNRDISQMAYELMIVSPDRSLAHYKIHENYIAPLEGQARLRSIFGVIKITFGTSLVASSVVAVCVGETFMLASLAVPILLPLTMVLVGTSLGLGLFGQSIYNKGITDFSEPELRRDFNNIIETSIKYYTDKNYQAFIEHLATVPANKPEFRLIEITENKKKCIIRPEKIVEIMLGRGFQSTGIAYLLNLIAEVFLTNRVYFSEMLSDEFSTEAKNICRQIINNQLLTDSAKDMDKGVEKEINQYIKKAGENTLTSFFINLKLKLRHLSNRYILEIPESYLKDAEKVPFSIRLQEYRNIATINLILLSLNNLQEKDLTLLRTMLNDLARSFHQMEIYIPNIKIRIEALDDFITACFGFESNFDFPTLSTLYKDQEEPISMSVDLDAEEIYKQAHTFANKEGATNKEKSTDKYAFGMKYLIEASRFLAQEEQCSKIKLLKCYYKASKAFKEAISYDIENVDAYLKYVESLVQQYKFKDAKNFLLTHKDRLFNKAEFHLLLSESLKGLHSYDLALHKINEAIRIFERSSVTVPDSVCSKRYILQRMQKRLNEKETKSCLIDKKIVLDYITKRREVERYNILSVDGGGIRGVLPGIWLCELEKRTHKPIACLFDMVAGTSTGAILGASLTLPDTWKGPKYSADEIVKIYTNRGSEVFEKRWTNYLPTSQLFGINFYESQYKDDGRLRIIKEYAGDTRMSEALTDLVITAVNEHHNSETHLFTNNKGGKFEDHSIKDVLMATSAAPTFFPAYSIDDVYYLDGGLQLNNPAGAAYGQALTCGVDPNNMFMLSMGTGDCILDPLSPNVNRGALFYAYKLKDAALPGLSGNVDRDMRSNLKTQYKRWQTYFEEPFAMDDVSPEAVEKLIDHAELFLEEQDASDDNTFKKLIEYLSDYEKTPRPTFSL